ncbi:hypothetical protein [Photorhabdus bodei]|uniref:Uncharacterized protein n=1 Tax=Photorhabdus bodei TaxID=2029681 RepID=A0AAW6BNK2_9GAMM|nr:hypothetical protein [Photorhabdus bodei]MDB6374381.1 hypothetical protein [Photorhabdus bodei]
MTGVSECSQQRGNLKDNGYTTFNSTTAALTRIKPTFYSRK